MLSTRFQATTLRVLPGPKPDHLDLSRSPPLLRPLRISRAGGQCMGQPVTINLVSIYFFFAHHLLIVFHSVKSYIPRRNPHMFPFAPSTTDSKVSSICSIRSSCEATRADFDPRSFQTAPGSLGAVRAAPPSWPTPIESPCPV